MSIQHISTFSYNIKKPLFVWSAKQIETANLSNGGFENNKIQSCRFLFLKTDFGGDISSTFLKTGRYVGEYRRGFIFIMI
ncbi:hypothetical protein J6TS1_18360 [Siminovitchia terrae]|uniref:Uncharacterized protein n=1 Tax=Siminovitchia terrae TaxID=1914933 RepID=A0ABQ4KWH8_SIMTE|nr:hypothetical protein J22TS1_47160 [Siminovitchia terrae]GIN95966.1 hypothetical protein J6TS1_18360 [Siminovitchia terrae]